jgi:hypothetical protein
LLHLARELIDDGSTAASKADEEGRGNLALTQRHRTMILS